MGYEISVGDYGRAMFECMVGESSQSPYSVPDHWESIRAEAEPLVRQLIALNEKMVRTGSSEPYDIIGVYEPTTPGEKKKKKKKTLSRRERIELAQEMLWGVATSDLKEGDKVWINDGDGVEMYILDDEPEVVFEVTKKSVYFDRGRQGTYKVDRTKHRQNWIFKAPADFDEKVVVTKNPGDFYETHTNEYQTEEYWLARADELGI